MNRSPTTRCDYIAEQRADEPHRVAFLQHRSLSVRQVHERAAHHQRAGDDQRRGGGNGAGPDHPSSASGATMPTAPATTAAPRRRGMSLTTSVRPIPLPKSFLMRQGGDLARRGRTAPGAGIEPASSRLTGERLNQSAILEWSPRAESNRVLRFTEPARRQQRFEGTCSAAALPLERRDPQSRRSNQQPRRPSAWSTMRESNSPHRFGRPGPDRSDNRARVRGDESGIRTRVTGFADRRLATCLSRRGGSGVVPPRGLEPPEPAFVALAAIHSPGAFHGHLCGT